MKRSHHPYYVLLSSNVNQNPFFKMKNLSRNVLRKQILSRVCITTSLVEKGISDALVER